MGHIVPVSKRGEVILMKKMGFTHSAQPSSGERRSFDAFFSRNMTDQEVKAMEELFPANITRAGKTTRRPLAAAA